MDQLGRLYRSFFFPVLGLLLFLLISAACGKKEPPRLVLVEKPDAPVNLSAIHREGEMHLSWSYPGEMDFVDGFKVQRRAGGEGFRDAAIVNDSSYADKDFKTGEVYIYRVLARSAKGILGDPSNELEAKPVEPPPPPSWITYSIGTDSVTISWKYEDNDAVFNVYKSSQKGKYGLKPLNPSPLSSVSITDNVSANETVYYSVRALLGGRFRDEGSPSEDVSVKPEDFVPSAPHGLTAIPVEGAVLVMWKENPEAWIGGYRVYGTDEEGVFRSIGETQTPAFADKGPMVEGRLYRVAALGPVTEGPPSESTTAVGADRVPPGK